MSLQTQEGSLSAESDKFLQTYPARNFKSICSLAKLSHPCKAILACAEHMADSAELHLVGKGGLTAQYILVLDALNFCFWPQSDLEYDNLAKGLKVRAQTCKVVSQVLLHASS